MRSGSANRDDRNVNTVRGAGRTDPKRTLVWGTHLNHSCDDKRTWDRTCPTDIAFRRFVFLDWFWLITCEHLVQNLYLFREIYLFIFVFLERMIIEEFRIFIERGLVRFSQSICEIITVSNFCFQFSFLSAVRTRNMLFRNSLYLWEKKKKKKFQWIIYPANKFFLKLLRQKLRSCRRYNKNKEKKAISKILSEKNTRRNSL